MGKSPGCWRYSKHEEGLKRGAWTPSEDKILIEHINTHGIGRWRDLPRKTGLRRCGKSCRLRWLNYLRPDIKRGNISPEEDELLVKLHRLLGNRWTLIAGRLPGRTDNEIRNYWNTQLSKRAQKGEFDPKYQEPFKERAIHPPSIYDKGVLHKDDYSYDIIVDGDNLDSYDHDCVPDTHDGINQEEGFKATNHHVAEIDTSKSWCQLLLEDCMGDYQYDRLEEISGLHPNNMTNSSNVTDDQHQPQSPFVSQSIILQENHSSSSCDLIQPETPYSKDFISSYFGSFLDMGEQAILLP